MKKKSAPAEDLSATFKTIPTCVLEFDADFDPPGSDAPAPDPVSLDPTVIQSPVPAGPSRSDLPSIEAAGLQRATAGPTGIEPPVIQAQFTENAPSRHPAQGRDTHLLVRRCTVDRGAGAVADYALRDKIGEGGSGLVYAASQNTIDREVAIKVIRPQMAQDAAVKSSFLSEAVLTGDLDHPNIIPVYDLAVDQDNCLFYAMKKIKGVSWKKVIAEKSAAENIDILLKVCDAVAFSHAKGVVHRDLKPHNIMLGDYGEVFVMDWGIAVSPTGNPKAEALTSRSHQAGTPVYMAPEMAQADPRRVNHLSDIYLLGGLLYEIETGLTPHAGGNLTECLQRVAANIIQPTDRQSELIDIALRAMATRPSERYQSVAEFSQAIRDYQSHAQSIGLCKKAFETHRRARESNAYDDFLMALFSYENALAMWPDNSQAAMAKADVKLDYAAAAFENKDFDLAISLLDEDNATHRGLLDKVLTARLARQSHQKHLKWLKIGSLTLALVTLITVSAGLLLVNMEKNRAVRAEKEMRIAQEQALTEYYFSAIALAARKVSDRLFGQARALLAKLPPRLRGWEWGRLHRLCRMDLTTFEGHDQPVVAVAFSPDERFVATADRGGSIRIWNRSGGPAIRTIIHPTASGQVDDLRFSVDGEALIAMDSGGAKLSWNVDDGSLIRIDHPAGDHEAYIFYSADRKYFIKRTLENMALIQDTQDNRTIRELRGHEDAIYTADFAPAGAWVVTGAADKSAIIWNINSGEPLLTLRGHDAGIQAVRFSPTGQYVLTGAADRTAKLWSTRLDRDQLHFSGHRSFVSTVAFSPDSRKLATGSHDGTVKIWDIGGRKEERTLKGWIGRVNAVQFTPDGRLLIAGGAWNAAAVWRVDTGELAATLVGHAHSVASVAVSPDGKYLATGSWDSTIKLWDAGTFQESAILTGHTGPVIAIRFSPDGRLLASGGKDRTARLWDIGSVRTIRELKAHTASIYSVDFSPDGRLIATGSWDKTIAIWDAATGQVRQVLSGHTASVYAVSFLGDDARLLSAGWDKSIKIWDTQSGQELMELGVSTAPLKAVAVSPDGTMAAASGRDTITVVWEADPYD